MAHDALSTLWYTRCPLPTASGMALDAGILESELAAAHHAVRSIEASDDPAARHSHFTHAARRLFRQGGNIPPIWARSQQADTALVGIAWTPEYQTILASPASGIRRAEDLRGKRLALPVRTSGEIDFWQAMCLRAYESALAMVGLDLGDVELVRLPVAERYIETSDPARPSGAWMWAGSARLRRQQTETFAWIRGEVDAMYASGALGVQLEAMLSAHVVVDLGFATDPARQVNNQVPNVLTVDRTLARERPDIVGHYLRALQKAADWAVEHADAARRAVAAEIGAPEEWVVPAYGKDFAGRLRLDLAERSVSAIHAQKRFLLAHGFIARDFDVAQWIDPHPLRLSQLSPENH